MKFDRKKRVVVVIIIAALFLLYGFLGMAFDIRVNPKFDKYASTILLIIAFVLIFAKDKVQNDNSDNDGQSDHNEGEEPPKELEDNASKEFKVEDDGMYKESDIKDDTKDDSKNND